MTQDQRASNRPICCGHRRGACGIATIYPVLLSAVRHLLQSRVLARLRFGSVVRIWHCPAGVRGKLAVAVPVLPIPPFSAGVARKAKRPSQPLSASILVAPADHIQHATGDCKPARLERSMVRWRHVAIAHEQCSVGCRRAFERKAVADACIDQRQAVLRHVVVQAARPRVDWRHHRWKGGSGRDREREPEVGCPPGAATGEARRGERD